MGRTIRSLLVIGLAGACLWGCSDDQSSGDEGNGTGDADSDTDGDADSDSDSDADADGDARHDFCADVGDTFGMGAAIFGDTGTDWVMTASGAPDNVDWTYGYMYASGDPHDDLEGFAWITNYRLDTAQEMGATIPTVTFYRMLNVGKEHGYSGSEPEIVQQMLQDKDAMHDYIDDFVALLEVLATRTTPTLIHVEPDSWGFMMWAFDGVNGTEGNGDASSIPVDLSGVDQPALAGQSFGDNAGGLGQAMLTLRNQLAPEARMGWHGSNFRVGTHPEVVTSFYSSMGAWDVIVTEPPHMVNDGATAWDAGEQNNNANFNWLDTVSSTTGLPILIWQTHVDDGASYLGDWPGNKQNMTAFAQRGVVGVLWDPNGVGSDCGYNCADAGKLVDYLSDYSAEPLRLPSTNICLQKSK